MLTGGRRHFKRKRKGAWEEPPKTKCQDCGDRHWYFDREEVGCIKGKGKTKWGSHHTLQIAAASEALDDAIKGE